MKIKTDGLRVYVPRDPSVSHVPHHFDHAEWWYLNWYSQPEAWRWLWDHFCGMWQKIGSRA